MSLTENAVLDVAVDVLLDGRAELDPQGTNTGVRYPACVCLKVREHWLMSLNEWPLHLQSLAYR
jgi:hypothetical protein